MAIQDWADAPEVHPSKIRVGDIISVTYVDASGRRRTQHNVYIPWSMTVTPISQSDVGSVEASSLFRVSRLNCSITTSDGTVLSSNTNDSPQTSC
ncbi:hypothetical protein A5681_23915 [Mycobacterium scrofulaceum]|nr:hypothetical protein A5681_23915 [Mycobacterium scrofulaceum]